MIDKRYVLSIKSLLIFIPAFGRCIFKIYAFDGYFSLWAL